MIKTGSSNIGIIILAAGKSERFKGDKRQAILKDGQMLLEATLANIPESFTNRLLVLHPGDEDFAKKINPEWEICISRDSNQGMGSSLANAMPLITHWSGTLIGLGDMPFIKPESYSRLQLALAQHPIVFPVIANKRGNPVGFSSVYFSDLAQLNGDQGARKLLEKYSADCHPIKCEDEGLLKDIDTQSALTIFQENSEE